MTVLQTLIEFSVNTIPSTLHTVPSHGVKHLTIGAYSPLTGPCWGGGQIVKLIIELALSQVNNRTDILPGYELGMVINDTKVCIQQQHLNLTYFCNSSYMAHTS